MKPACKMISALAVLPLLLASLPADAAEPLDTFSLRISGYAVDFDTKVRADGSTENGTPINLGRDLGLDSNNVVANIGLSWRPWQDHQFGLDVRRQSADKTRVLDRSFTFEDNLYQAQGTVRASSDIDTYEAYYVWWAANHQTWALGPRLGLVWFAWILICRCRSIPLVIRWMARSQTRFRPISRPQASAAAGAGHSPIIGACRPMPATSRWMSIMWTAMSTLAALGWSGSRGRTPASCLITPPARSKSMPANAISKAT